MGLYEKIYFYQEGQGTDKCIGWELWCELAMWYHLCLCYTKQLLSKKIVLLKKIKVFEFLYSAFSLTSDLL